MQRQGSCSVVQACRCLSNTRWPGWSCGDSSVTHKHTHTLPRHLLFSFHSLFSFHKKAHTSPNFSDPSHFADLREVIVLGFLSWAVWWQGGDTASRGSTPLFTRFKCGDEATSPPVVFLQVCQHNTNSMSRLTAKQTICMRAQWKTSQRITGAVCTAVLGNTMSWATKEPHPSILCCLFQKVGHRGSSLNREAQASLSTATYSTSYPLQDLK